MQFLGLSNFLVKGDYVIVMSCVTKKERGGGKFNGWFAKLLIFF